MKFRLLSLFFVFLIILNLSACGEKKAEYRVAAFNEAVRIKGENKSFEGSLIFSSADNIVFEITEPERISGLTFSLCDGEKALKQGDLSIKGTGFGGVFTLLEALSCFARGSYTLPLTGSHKISFNYGGEDYIFTFSCERGCVEAIEGGGLALKIS